MARDVVEGLLKDLDAVSADLFKEGRKDQSDVIQDAMNELSGQETVVEAAKREMDEGYATVDLRRALARLYAGSSGESEKRLPPIEDLDYMPPRGCVG